MRKVSVSVSILALALLAACSKSPFVGKWADTEGGAFEFKDDGSCTVTAPDMPAGMTCKWNKTGDADMELHLSFHAKEGIWKGHLDKDSLTFTGTETGQPPMGPLHKS